MSKNEEIIRAWKQPELRKSMTNIPEHPSGIGFHEMDVEEMASVTGGAEVTPATTPAISVISNFISRSTKACIGVSVSAIGGIVSYNKDCLG